TKLVRASRKLPPKSGSATDLARGASPAGDPFVGAEKVPVVLIPWMEAGHEKAQPSPSDFAEHAGMHPQIPKQQRPGSQACDAVLPHEFKRSGGSVDDEVARDIKHQLCLHLPPFPPSPVMGRVQPSVVSHTLMLDLLDRVPAP